MTDPPVPPGHVRFEFHSPGSQSYLIDPYRHYLDIPVPSRDDNIMELELPCWDGPFGIRNIFNADETFRLHVRLTFPEQEKQDG